MSNLARKQFGLGPEQLRVKNKNEQLPSHDLHLGLSVMYQDSVTQDGIQPLLQAYAKNPEATKVTTKDGIIYRETQAHLKPYQPWYKYNENELNSCNMRTVKSDLQQARPKRNRKCPVKLDL